MSARRRRSGSGRSRRAGYTLIEVMMAIAIVTASSVAILSLQEITIRGNMDARQLATATTIARRTLELLRLDAVAWTTSYSTAGAVTWGAGGLGYLRDVPTAAAIAPTPWGRFGATINSVDHAYDYQGNPTAVVTDMFYCVETRYAWVYPGSAVRADVRVWWVRRSNLTNAATYAGCPLQPAVIPINDLHSLQSTMVIRFTPPPPP